MRTAPCPQCGAPIPVNPDGTVSGCTYCGTGAAKAIDPLALATTFSSHANDTQRLIESLAGMLETPAFAPFAKIERSGFFTKKISGVRIEVKTNVYKLDVGSGAPVAVKSKTVRGVALKNENVPLRQWLEEVSHALADLATESKEAHQALQKFVR